MDTAEKLRRLEDVLSRILEYDFAEECQECAIGRSEPWYEAKVLLGKMSRADADTLIAELRREEQR